jgi:hypothetical protein
MANCNRCGVETSLYDSGVPICPQCSDRLYAERKTPEQQAIEQFPAPDQPDNSTGSANMGPQHLNQEGQL